MRGDPKVNAPFPSSSATLTAIISHPPFRRFAAMLRLALRTSHWREKRVPFHKIADHARWLFETPLPHDKTAFFNHVTPILLTLQSVDPRLTWTQSEATWLVSCINNASYGDSAAAMLIAFSIAPDVMVSLPDLAELTNTPMNTWRGRCQRGDVPGADIINHHWFVSSEALISFLLPSAHAHMLDDALRAQRRYGWTLDAAPLAAARTASDRNGDLNPDRLH